MPQASVVLRGARVLYRDGLHDVAIAGGVIMAVGRALEVPDAVAEFRADGRWVMPGLADAHVHFTQWARHRSRVSVAAARSAAEAAALLRAVPGADLRGADPAGADVLVASGFQDALWPDRPTAAMLAGERPTVVISHDLHTVWLNDRAAALLGVEPGALREEAAFAAQIALDRLLDARAGSDAAGATALVASTLAAAAARGITRVRDLELADNPAVWADRAARWEGALPLRVDACFYPEHREAVAARGLPTGAVVPGTDGMVSVGSLKLFADGSLNTRTAWCADPYPDGTRGHAAHTQPALEALVADARDRGWRVALHAIGDSAVAAALDAFAATGASGSIEHAQLVTDRDAARFAALGIAASVQPEHALDDRDVTDAMWAGRTARAFPYGTLAAAGAELWLGSDAPVAPLDPWIAVAAATERARHDGREPWHPEQALTRQQALAASTRSAIAPGEPADMVVLDADPLTCDAATLRAMPVAATLVAGRTVHDATGGQFSS